MKLWNLVTLLTVSILTFSGCVATTPKPKDTAVVDSTLPVITLTQNGVFTDMQAVGFEWNSITDARVKGVYVYKQTLDKEETEPKYYDTVKNRFVTHYVDDNVKPQTQYSYYFKTYSKDSESQASKSVTVKTLPVLDSVSWIYVAQDMPRSAKIIWRPHTNHIVKSYIIERKTLSEDKWSKLETIKGRLNAEYIDTELKDNYVYKYRIRVVTYTNIVSNPSAEVKVITKALPKQIENIVATKDLPKKITIVWGKTNIVDFMHYNIYRAGSIDGNYDLITSVKTNQFIDEVEEDGKNYFYRISVVDKDELESNCAVKSTHGKTLARPLTPSMVEVRIVNNNLEISWNSNDSRVKSYSVIKKISRNWLNISSEEFTDIKGKTFVDTAVEPNTTYFYTVYSVDNFSIKSEPSLEVKFTTSKTQGKKIVSKEADIDVKKSPSDNGNTSSVNAMDDFDMSEN
ncbi:MAG: hypothetical protein K8R44_04110 [Sulfurimonas sp.]|nr:hypothetical protein [Sulfurimonas sp.]